MDPSTWSPRIKAGGQKKEARGELKRTRNLCPAGSILTAPRQGGLLRTSYFAHKNLNGQEDQACNGLRRRKVSASTKRQAAAPPCMNQTPLKPSLSIGPDEADFVLSCGARPQPDQGTRQRRQVRTSVLRPAVGTFDADPRVPLQCTFAAASAPFGSRLDQGRVGRQGTKYEVGRTNYYASMGLVAYEVFRTKRSFAGCLLVLTSVYLVLWQAPCNAPNGRSIARPVPRPSW